MKKIPIVINLKNGIGGVAELSHCLLARDYKGIGNQDMVAVLEYEEDTNRSELGGQQTEHIRCLRARYTAGITKHRGVASGILEIYEKTDMCNERTRQNESEPPRQDEQQLLPEDRDKLGGHK